MRDILFRGKSNNKWVYGYFIQALDIENKPLKNCIIENMSDVNVVDGKVKQDYYEIELSSLGQYTRLIDKNGTKIFDGDILVFCKGATYPIKVYWDGLGWKFLRNGKRIDDAFECNIISHIQECEVIGNIYDNPELLEGNV